METVKTLKARIIDAVVDQHAQLVAGVIKEMCEDLVSAGHGSLVANTLEGFVRTKTTA